MRYFRCRCGKSEAYSSMGVPRCQGCSVCNTNLTEEPSRHTEPAPHTWIEEWRINRQTGERWQVRECRRCQREERIGAGE